MVSIGVASSMLAFVLSKSVLYQCSNIGRSVRLLSSFKNADNLVSSTKSQTVKKIQAVMQNRRKRMEYGLTVVEGPRTVLDLLRSSTTTNLVQQILIDENKYNEYYPQIVKAAANTRQYLPTILPATKEVMEFCTDTVTTQGIVALVQIPMEFPHMKSCLYPLYLIADAVADPGNLGTLLRSSVATGVAAIYLLPGSCDPWNPKAIRSAMGTTFQIPIVAFDSWHDCREQLATTKQCHRIYAATMLDDNMPEEKAHYQVDWLSEPTALIIGNEGTGLTTAVRQSVIDTTDTAVMSVHVPMEPGIESLNAAVCGSVILFEYLRQRKVHSTPIRSERE